MMFRTAALASCNTFTVGVGLFDMAVIVRLVAVLVVEAQRPISIGYSKEKPSNELDLTTQIHVHTCSMIVHN